MEKGRRFLRKLFRDPRAMVFGVSVFTFGWVYTGSSEGTPDPYVFVASLLLTSSALILIKRALSNFVAAGLCGYLAVELAFQFWMTPRREEVPTFSFEHFAYFARDLVNIDGAVALFCGLTVLILACSAHTLMRLESGRETAEDDD